MCVWCGYAEVWAMARVVERAVLPWNHGRTRGSTNFWGRNGVQSGRFYHGILVERAVLLIFGGEMVFRTGGSTMYSYSYSYSYHDCYS